MLDLPVDGDGILGPDQRVEQLDLLLAGMAKESDELIEEARQIVDEAIERCLDRGITDWGKLKNTTKDALSDFVWKKTKRRPMILPIIMEV